MPAAQPNHEPPTLNRGKRWPATVLLAAPFIFILIPLYRAARHGLNRKALVFTLLTFEVLMFVAEHFSLSRGHWVWNEARILGPKIWNVPIEEPLIYYWLGPFFVITLFQALKNKIEKKGDK
jgi:lycopene cyclase domain-containing protein